MKVLIADDNVISSRALAANLEDWVYSVVQTRNGREAWDALNTPTSTEKQSQNEIRLALLDWEMPEVNGIELCRRIRRREHCDLGYLYIILMTGRDHQEDILQGLAAGADDYMIKPFDHTELKVRVQNGFRIASMQTGKEIRRSQDELTQVWNQPQIMEFLEEEIARNRRQNQPTGAVLVEIGRPEPVNQTLNVSVGDQILWEVALRLKKSMRRYDKLGRCGDCGLLAVFPGCRTEQLHIITERLRRDIVQVSLLREQAGITISLGGTSSESSPDCSARDLLHACRHVLDSAKSGGQVLIQPLAEEG